MSTWLRYLAPVLSIAALTWVAAGCSGPVPPSSSAMLRAAASAYERGDDITATERLGAFIAAHPESQEAGEAHYVRGLVRGRTGDWDGAEADLHRAIELTERDDLRGCAHLALAYAAGRRGDAATAQINYVAALDTLRMRSAPTEQALYGLGVLLQRRGEWLEADRRFDRLTFLFPSSPQAAAASQRVRARAWTIRAGTFDRREPARHAADRLRQAGLDPRVTVTGGAAPRFVVQVGRHENYVRASQAATSHAEPLPGGVIEIARD